MYSTLVLLQGRILKNKHYRNFVNSQVEFFMQDEIIHISLSSSCLPPRLPVLSVVLGGDSQEKCRIASGFFKSRIVTGCLSRVWNGSTVALEVVRVPPKPWHTAVLAGKAPLYWGLLQIRLLFLYSLFLDEAFLPCCLAWLMVVIDACWDDKEYD